MQESSVPVTYAVKPGDNVTDDEDFTEAGGQLTLTMKMRRHVITGQSAAKIAALYETAPASSALSGSGEEGGDPADGDGHPAGR